MGRRPCRFTTLFTFVNDYINIWRNFMSIALFVFCSSLIIIGYNYLGYGLLLAMVAGVKKLFRRRNTPPRPAAPLPDVTLVVAAYNEESFIARKIENSLALDYPRQKLNLIFITEGSTDRTYDIACQYPAVQVLHGSERLGKTAAINRAMQHVKTPVTVFCDANTLLNPLAIREIVKHYEDNETGAVAGEKKIIVKNDSKAAGVGEGLYWKYESFLKKLEADLYSVIGAAGELFSIRTTLWEPVDEEVILDDFIISLKINLKGYRVAYEPAAYAMEYPSASIDNERKRKVRISAGAFQAIGMLREIFNIFKYPVLFFQFFSHRLLRWTLTPLCFLLLLISNLYLVMISGNLLFNLFFSGQLLFYALALYGMYYADKRIRLKAAYIAYYVFFMNLSVYLGFFRFLRGSQSAIWERAFREEMA